MSQNPQEQQASQQQDLDQLRTELLSKVNRLLKDLQGQDAPEVKLDEIVIVTDDKCEIEVEADTQQSGDKCTKSLKDYIQNLKKMSKEPEKRRRNLERDCGLFGSVRAFLVAGKYDCEKEESKEMKKITIYLSCYKKLERCRSVEGAKRFILETLAHELIHHLQYTGAMLKVGNEEEKEKKKGKKGKDEKEERKFEVAVRYNGCDDSLAKEVNNRVPYLYRPHEVEAFARQQAFFDLLSGDREVRKVVSRLVDAYREVLGV